MSRTTRTLLRTAVPPLLALALASLLVHPLSDDAAAASLPSTGGHLTATTDGRSDATSSDHRATPSGNVSVSVPVVAFQQSVRVTGSHLRTAVLVNLAAPRGVATVVGQPGCRSDASPGQVAWLDCAVTRDLDEVTVKVVLADHRVYTRTVATERR